MSVFSDFMISNAAKNEAAIKQLRDSSRSKTLTSEELERIDMELLTLMNECRRLEVERERNQTSLENCQESLQATRYSVLQAIADIVAGKEF